MKIKIITLKEGFIGYKSAKEKLWNYDVFKKSYELKNDWSGLYIAEDEELAKGYLNNYLVVEDGVIKGDQMAYIHKVYLEKSVKIIICNEEGFKTGDRDEKKLKSALSELKIKINEDDKLIQRLAERGYLFNCYNNEEGKREIIVGSDMVKDNIRMELHKTYKYNKKKIEFQEIK